MSRWFRAPRALCLLFLVAAGRPALAQTGAPAMELPSWRFQVQPYGGSNTAYALGIYKRLSGRLDLGLEIDSSIRTASSSRHDTDSFNDTTSVTTAGTVDSDYRSIALYVDVRWWHPVVERVQCFAGLQLGGTYSESESKDHDDGINYSGEPYSRDSRSSSIGRSLSLSPRFGADLLLLEHLSFLISVRPVSLSQTWQDQDSWSDSSTSLPEGGHDDRDTFQVETTFTAQAFVTLML